MANPPPVCEAEKCTLCRVVSGQKVTAQSNHRNIIPFLLCYACSSPLQAQCRYHVCNTLEH